MPIRNPVPRNPVPPWRRFARVLGWCLLGGLACVTLAPIGLRPVSGAPVSIEHFAAFSVLGLLLAAGYPRHRRIVLVLSVAAAGLFEAGQMLEPSRHAHARDFILKALGCGFGWTLAQAWTRLATTRRRIRLRNSD